MLTLLLLCFVSFVQPDIASRDLLARDRALVDAFLQNDQAAIRDLYATDAIVMPPNVPAISGHAKILPWAKEISGVLQAFAASPISAKISGDLAWIAGTYTMTVKLPDGKTADDRGKYLEVWRREEGRWRIVADMFNSDLPAR
jgi:ketosteroid isomerase-like protein